MTGEATTTLTHTGEEKGRSLAGRRVKRLTSRVTATQSEADERSGGRQPGETLDQSGDSRQRKGPWNPRASNANQVIASAIKTNQRSGTNISATMLMILIKGFTAGPAVSL